MILRRLAPWLWVAYLVVPARGWGLFDGFPLDVGSLVALSALCWLWWVRGKLWSHPLLVVAVVAKIAAGTLMLVPRGFDARYYASSDFTGAVEQSSEPASPGFTRIDDRLAFGLDRDLPTHFFNDAARFNFYLPGQPDRSALPVSVIWDGRLRITDGGVQEFYLRSEGARVTLAVGSSLSATVTPASPEWRGDAKLEAGMYRLMVTASMPQGTARSVEAGRLVHGVEEPFDRRIVFRGPVSGVRLAADWLTRTASVVLDIMLAAWLLLGVAAEIREAIARLQASRSPHDVLALVWALGVVDALIFALPWLNRFTVLSGGNDWLTYETMARSIVLTGSLWMNGGAAVGHGQAFYNQPLYPYLLAACHAALGEGLFGVCFVQRLLAAVALVAMWRTTAQLFGERVGLAGLMAGLAVVYAKFATWSGILLSETLFVPFVCVWAYLLVRLARPGHGTWRRAVVAGVVGGLATLTRSTLLLGWVAAIPLLFLSITGSRRRRCSLVGVMMAAMMAVVSLATLRNWVVASEFVPITTSGPVNLFIGNQPAAEMEIPPQHQATYKRLGLHPQTQRVVEYARQRPGEFLDGLHRKALYTLGWFESLLPREGRSEFYVAIWVLAAAGALLIPVVGSAMPAGATMTPWSLAAMHFAAVVAIFPNVYGDRLIVPFYVLLVPYVAVALTAAAGAVGRLGIGVRPTMLAALTVFAVGVCVAPWRVRIDLNVVAVVLACGAALAGRHELRSAIWWFCAACMAALAKSLVLEPSFDAVTEFRRQLAFVAIVLSTAGLSRAVWQGSPEGAAARFGRRAVVGTLLPAACMIAALLTPLLPRLSLETVSLPVRQWSSIRALLEQHWWFGAGLDASASAGYRDAGLEAGNAVVWFLVSAGVIGVTCYHAIWVRAIWGAGSRPFDWRSTAALGMLFSGVAVLLGAADVVTGPKAASGALLLLGVMLGLSESSRESTPEVRPPTV